MVLRDTAVLGKTVAEVNKRDNFAFGLTCSLALHFGFVLFLLFYHPTARVSRNQVVYSVSLEGGARLGGLSQVPDEKQKTNVAPPKPTAEENKEKERVNKNEEEQQKPPEKVPPEKAVPDAEVSLASPKPTAAPVKATPSPTAAPTPAATARATAKPKPTKAPNPKDELEKEYQKALQRYRGESTEAAGKGFGAGALGGRGMGGGVLRPPEFFTYRDALKNHLKRGWRWYEENSTLTTVVGFHLAANGAISDVYIVESSGNREYDESVLRAVYKASPAPTPPASVYQYFKDVRVEFTPEE